MRLGIVASGGGNFCGATAGAYKALWEVHRIHEPHVIVTVSGGTQPTLCHLARRWQDFDDWPRIFSDPRYISFRRVQRIMDLDWLVDEGLTPQYPQLYETVAQTSTKLFFAATTLRGSVRWLTNHDLRHKEKIKKATSAVPGFYGKTIEIDGEQLFDGCLAVTLRDCVDKAFNQGADRVLVIDTEGGPFSFAGASLYRCLSWKQGPAIRRIVRSYVHRVDPPVVESVSVMICRPRSPVRHALDNDAERIFDGIKSGYETMAALRP